MAEPKELFSQFKKHAHTLILPALAKAVQAMRQNDADVDTGCN